MQQSDLKAGEKYHVIRHDGQADSERVIVSSWTLIAEAQQDKRNREGASFLAGDSFRYTVMEIDQKFLYADNFDGYEKPKHVHYWEPVFPVGGLPYSKCSRCSETEHYTKDW
jgi:hypothetical protein